MAPLIDMHVGQVYSAGRSISALSGDAGAAARSFLSALSEAEGAVVHSTVAAALGRYHSTWSTPAHRLAHDVDAIGQDTAGSAVDVSTGDNQAAGVVQGTMYGIDPLAARLNTGPAL
jgi:hypothetical protein